MEVQHAVGAVRPEGSCARALHHGGRDTLDADERLHFLPSSLQPYNLPESEFALLAHKRPPLETSHKI